jgi:L-threonylcarbamoyladenylate synthase
MTAVKTPLSAIPSGQPAVFLDRDGTLIEDRGYLRDPQEVVFYDETIESLRRLQPQVRLFIVTNQSGVGKGLVTAAEVDRVNAFVVDHLRQQGVLVTALYCCPHQREDGCDCIKPKPFFLEAAARDFGLDLQRSFVVGDHPCDVELALGVGALGLHVLTGHGLKHRHEIPAGGITVPGIREAAEWVLACLEMWRQEMRNPGLLHSAAELLRRGGIVAFPTETVYGLGAVVFDEKAVARVFEAKQRPRFDPLIVHVNSVEQLERLTERIPPEAYALIDRFWPGPLTLILPKAASVPDLVTAGLPTVAVRMPRHPMALELIRQTGLPIAAPSANPFGHTSPTTADHVRGSLGGRIDCVLDGGTCSVGIESTILSFCDRPPVLLRLGGVPVEEIEALIGAVAKAPMTTQKTLCAPGMLPRHYAPHTRFHVLSGPESGCVHAGERTGLLAFKNTSRTGPFAATEYLSENGDLREAAANLFGAMRRLDELGLDRIVAEPVPNVGLGRAINDRLFRAAGIEQTQAQPQPQA